MPATSSRIALRLVATFVLLLLAAAPAMRGQFCCDFCPDEYTLSGPFPYFETIRLTEQLATTEVTPATGWQRVFESCADTRGVNVDAAADVALVLRAYFSLDAGSRPGTLFAYRWSIDGVVVSPGALHQVRDGFPQIDQLAAVVPHLPAGPHRVAIDARVFAPETGRLHFDVQYVTAQGVPADRMPADSEAVAAPVTIGGAWTAPFAPLELTTAEASHLFLQSQLTFTGGHAGDAVEARYVVNGTPLPVLTVGVPHALPESFMLFDHRSGGASGNPAGTYTVTLELRALGEPVTLATRTLEAFTTPAATTDGSAIPQLDLASPAGATVVVTPDTNGVQPLDCLILDGGTGGPGGMPNCGRYTLLLDGELAGVGVYRSYTMIGDGFVEIVNRSGTNGVVTLAVEAVSLEQRPGSDAVVCAAKLAATEPTACTSIETTCHSGDFVVANFVVPPGRSQVPFFSEFFAWGVRSPTRVRLWMRLPTGCFAGASTDGELTVGRRSLALQLVPEGDVSCFSIKTSRRLPAPAFGGHYVDWPTRGVALSWNTEVAGLHHTIQILRADGDGDFVPFLSSAGFNDEVVDANVVAGHTYHYRARLIETSDYEPAICGIPSPELTVTIPLPRRRAASH